MGTAAAYCNDYRSQHRPDEEISVGRAFRIREGMSLSVRAMFYNILNRTYLQVPDSTNAQATQVTDATGAVVSGFGRITHNRPTISGRETGVWKHVSISKMARLWLGRRRMALRCIGQTELE
jgi:hypothetical protein